MKKRLLALALCLVLATSLLPITAAADIYDDIEGGIQGITVYGKYCGDTYFTISVPENVSVTQVTWACAELPNQKLEKDNRGRYKLAADYGAGQVHIFFGGQFSNQWIIPLTIYPQHVWSDWTSNGDGTHSRSCKNGCNTSETKKCADTSPKDCKCDVAGESLHDWQFKAAGNTLTGTCRKGDIDPVTLTLKADSVTLPTSPFNARLEGLEQFKKEVPNAVIGDFVYKYKGPGDSEYSIVAPTAANAKAGQYQVGVRIKNLPGPVAQEGPVAMAYEGNQDNTGYADLYVQYTAADPAVTAQTGDDRPIELMMASVLVFSALAAAAFLLDHKRKYSR